MQAQPIAEIEEMVARAFRPPAARQMALEFAARFDHEGKTADLVQAACTIESYLGKDLRLRAQALEAAIRAAQDEESVDDVIARARVVERYLRADAATGPTLFRDAALEVARKIAARGTSAEQTIEIARQVEDFLAASGPMGSRALQIAMSSRWHRVAELIAIAEDFESYLAGASDNAAALTASP